METRETRLFASEIKFLVTPAASAEIERWARRWLAPDPHGAHYRVSSIYFDTPGRDVYERKGSFARGKYRIRRYGDSDHVFFERKLRSKNVVIKRRSIVDLEDLPLLEGVGSDRQWRGGYWFHRRIAARALQPAWQVQYDRTARVLETSAGLIRLTMDRDLCAAPALGFEFRAPGELQRIYEPGSEDRHILELKFRNRIPELFRDLMEDLVLTPQPVSKFRLAAGTLAYA
jgi:hypothetical protein